MNSEPWPWHRKVSHELRHRGWSRAELARRLGMKDPSPLRRWLDAINKPRPHVPARIAKALGWTLDYLMDPDQPWPPRLARQDAASIVAGLSEDALRVVSALADPQAVKYLARCVQQYEELKRSLGR